MGLHRSAGGTLQRDAEATGSNPVEAPKIFFSGYFAIAYIYVISYKSFALHGIFPSPFHLNNVNLFMTNGHLIYSCDNLCSANGKLAKSNSGCNFV